MVLAKFISYLRPQQLFVCQGPSSRLMLSLNVICHPVDLSLLGRPAPKMQLLPNLLPFVSMILLLSPFNSTSGNYQLWFPKLSDLPCFKNKRYNDRCALFQYGNIYYFLINLIPAIFLSKFCWCVISYKLSTVNQLFFCSRNLKKNDQVFFLHISPSAYSVVSLAR